jgi:16S rRNA (uracil1498-N3)-methyltransferase
VAGERALKKLEHWRGVAVAASEQSGRTRVPQIAGVLPLAAWLAALHDDAAGMRCVLSLSGDALPFEPGSMGAAAVMLSGPEGGLSDAEESAARATGFRPVSLGPRTLRADTAPLAVLAALALAQAGGAPA